MKEVDWGGKINGKVIQLLVRFGRDIDGIPEIHGKFGVRIGDKGKLEEIMIMHRELEPYQDVPTKSPAEAFEDLKNRNDCMLSSPYSPPPGCTKIVIDEVYLAYYMEPIVRKQEYVVPVYKFEGKYVDNEGNFIADMLFGYVQAVK